MRIEGKIWNQGFVFTYYLEIVHGSWNTVPYMHAHGMKCLCKLFSFFLSLTITSVILYAGALVIGFGKQMNFKCKKFPTIISKT